MKNKIIKSVLFGSILLFSSCSEFLDVNEDPNYPVSVTPEVLLPSGQVWVGAVTGGDLELIGGIWSQHYAQNNSSNQYTTIDSYNLNNANYNAIWTNLYSGALPDLKKTYELAAANSQWQYWLSAKVMYAFTFHILTDVYGNVPFTEAIGGETNPTPKLDDSKTVIYPGIIAILDEAIAKKDDADALDPMGNEDMVFQGSVANWVKFAKTLKLKLLMRDFDANKVKIDALLAEGDFLTSDAKLDFFVDSPDKSNPLYENDRRKLNTTNNLRGSETLINYLNANSDTRVGILFGKSSKGNYLGMPQGSYALLQPTSSFPTYSKATLEATDAVYFMSAAESFFLQAEAYARGADLVNAKSKYDLAVKSAFDRWALDGSTFVATGGVYEFSNTAPLTSILTQKWVASTRCQAWDAFLDINRTGIPALGTKYSTEAGYVSGELTPSKSSVLPVGESPKRMLYPKRSSDYNPNASEAIKLGLSAKMWWHK